MAALAAVLLWFKRGQDFIKRTPSKLHEPLDLSQGKSLIGKLTPFPVAYRAWRHVNGNRKLCLRKSGLGS